MRDSILVENLGKRFHRFHAQKPVTLMEAALSGFRRIKAVDDFWALRGVSFRVAAGEMLGVLGHNGAGKSTLLQLLGKVAHPTEGRLKMRGQVGALLDLGAGFHGDLTGRENVFVTAIAAGLLRREVTQRFDQIVEFAELTNFIDNPVRTYSTGMAMRLAFSVAVHTEPDILLVDEFLSVGDLSFQTKCLSRIQAMKEQGCAIVLVSHDVGQIERMCDRALWLKRGNVVAYGEPAVVVGQYTTEMRSQTQQRTPSHPPYLTKSGLELRVNENRFGSLEAEIVDVRLQPNNTLKSGDFLRINIDYLAHKPIDKPIFGVDITTQKGEIILSTNTSAREVTISEIEGFGSVQLQIDRLDLASGEYFINVGIYKFEWEYAYDFHWRVYPVSVIAKAAEGGLLNPPLKWKMDSSVTLSR